MSTNAAMIRPTTNRHATNSLRYCSGVISSAARIAVGMALGNLRWLSGLIIGRARQGLPDLLRLRSRRLYPRDGGSQREFRGPARFRFASPPAVRDVLA